jgi:hypothetical protein
MGVLQISLMMLHQNLVKNMDCLVADLEEELIDL